MNESKTYACDNCGKITIQENARFEITDEDFRAGYNFEDPVEDYQTVLCSKCYEDYVVKAGRSSYSEPDIDINAYNGE